MNEQRRVRGALHHDSGRREMARQSDRKKLFSIVIPLVLFFELTHNLSRAAMMATANDSSIASAFVALLHFLNRRLSVDWSVVV